ncbi:MAG: hypothetical protein IT324_05550 [Anaerolineae bacterium]|nr:hypothetical protein [Anaerolineae bacterium]
MDSSLDRLRAELDTMTQRLQDTSQQIDSAKRNLGQPRWLQSLRAMTRNLANTTLKSLPRVTRQMLRAWEQAARDQLTSQYNQWTAELDAVRDKAHDPLQ